MVTLKQLEEELITNDIAFSYKDKDYVICPLEKIYVGEAGNVGDNNSFDTFEEMANNWIIQGKALKDIISEIELL
ncbi:hypothetical protein M2651_05770 [Clostridium sp. SYSU_GA19001]|uniref:hypothetical protein n=1 Tax=Clostridium caldaquaticum TaxID=2940653 RepID=UPI002077208F|nr:hypothetical protein [Clostridium caldaquaticum]MCM8710533.1 hypothetical protein [Clostridium caldaquaticum]